jgi:hypothetical protein
MKIATCTPKDFEGNEHFFGRDSGLLSRGIRAAGAHSEVIMPGKPGKDFCDSLIRCRHQDLASTTWWKKRQLDGVVLYAWGDPRYLAVAKAIRRAGIPLIQSLDTAGLPSPYVDWKSWLQMRLGMASLPSPPKERLRRVAGILRDLVPSLYERRRVEMLEESEAIASVSPPASESIRGYLCGLGAPHLAERLMTLPHPVLPIMRYDGQAKQAKILVVGRWEPQDLAQKNPKVVMAVLGAFLEQRTDWTAEVIGKHSRSLHRLAEGWHQDAKGRLVLTDRLSHEELVSRYQTSRIILCASTFESFHIASAEGLCCGCSVVVGDHPLLASTAWFTTAESGTLAATNRTEDLIFAMLEESDRWTQKHRSAEGISRHWHEHLDASKVGENVISFFESTSQS